MLLDLVEDYRLALKVRNKLSDDLAKGDLQKFSTQINLLDKLVLDIRIKNIQRLKNKRMELFQRNYFDYSSDSDSDSDDSDISSSSSDYYSDTDSDSSDSESEGDEYESICFNIRRLSTIEEE